MVRGPGCDCDKPCPADRLGSFQPAPKRGLAIRSGRPLRRRPGYFLPVCRQKSRPRVADHRFTERATLLSWGCWNGICRTIRSEPSRPRRSRSRAGPSGQAAVTVICPPSTSNAHPATTQRRRTSTQRELPATDSPFAWSMIWSRTWGSRSPGSIGPISSFPGRSATRRSLFTSAPRSWLGNSPGLVVSGLAFYRSNVIDELPHLREARFARLRRCGI